MQKVEEREAITLINQGQKIFGVFHRPLHQVKVPAVLVCPGFAGNKCGKFRLFVILAEELAKLGIAVLRFDYRGSGDSEGSFHDMTLEGKVSDTLKCLEFLAQDSQIDVNRIGLFGRSLGGAIAIVAARRRQQIKSFALWAPVFNGTSWQALWAAFKSRQLEISPDKKDFTLPPIVPNLQFLDEFFKLHLQDELQYLKDIPLLHIHGEKDLVVKIDQAEAYQQAREGIDRTRFIRLPNTDHDFSDFSEQKIALMETCEWYEQTLLK